MIHLLCPKDKGLLGLVPTPDDVISLGYHYYACAECETIYAVNEKSLRIYKQLPKRAIWYELFYYQCPNCYRVYPERQARYTPKPEDKATREHWLMDDIPCASCGGDDESWVHLR